MGLGKKYFVYIYFRSGHLVGFARIQEILAYTLSILQCLISRDVRELDCGYVALALMHFSIVLASKHIDCERKGCVLNDNLNALDSAAH